MGRHPSSSPGGLCLYDSFARGFRSQQVRLHDRFSQDDADSDYSDGDDDPIKFDDEGRLVIGAPHSLLLILFQSENSAGWVKKVLDG